MPTGKIFLHLLVSKKDAKFSYIYLSAKNCFPNAFGFLFWRKPACFCRVTVAELDWYWKLINGNCNVFVHNQKMVYKATMMTAAKNPSSSTSVKGQNQWRKHQALLYCMEITCFWLKKKKTGTETNSLYLLNCYFFLQYSKHKRCLSFDGETYLLVISI